MKKLQLLFKTILFCGVLSNSSYAQFDKMVIGDNNNGQIVISNLNGTNLDTLTPTSLYQSFYDAEVDPINQKIYMAWYYGIYSMNYDGSNLDTLIFYPAGGYSDGVAVDATNGYLYWSSTPDKNIYRSDLNGTNVITLYTTTPNGYLADIDIDVLNNKLFFGQWIMSDKGIYSIDLDGNNLTQITTNDAQFIGLDIQNSKIYYTGNGTCNRINYNGSNDTIIYNFQGGGFFVDTINSILYTSDMTNNNIVSSGLNGSSPTNIFPVSILDSPHGPLLFSTTTTTGIENILENSNQVTISPNPFSTTTILHTDNTLENAILIVYNSYGQVIKQMNQLCGKTIILERDNLPNGVYYIRLTQHNKLITTEKLIITD